MTHPRDNPSTHEHPLGDAHPLRRARHRGFYPALGWLVVCGGLWGVLGLPGPINAQDTAVVDHDAWLAPQRWREHSHGLSLRPPRVARLIEVTPEDAVARFLGEGGYTLDVFLKTLPTPLSMRQLLDQAAAQLGTAHPSAVIVDQHQLELAGRRGGVIYFAIPDSSQGPWVKAQAFFYADDDTLAMIQLEVDQHAFDATRPIFDAVLHSLEVQDPAVLHRQRQQWIQRGIDWLETVPPQRWREAIQPQRWLRITENRVDVGYVRISQSTDTQMGLPGSRMDLQARVRVGDRAYDLISHCFASDDGSYEDWSTRSTLRPATPRARRVPPPGPGDHRGAAVQRDTFSWAETGLRSDADITVSRETLSGIHQSTWQRPPKGYLSQLQVHLLGRLLPRDQAGEYGFYAYNTHTQQVSLRTERVVPAGDGSCVIYSRPSLSQPEQAAHYDALGRLIKRVMPSGQVLMPTTQHELALRWKIK